MKKNRIRKITAGTKRNQKEVFKAKRRANRRVKHTIEYKTVSGPGPSKSIKYDKDGKVIGFVKWCEKGKKQKDYTTDMGKAAMDENKSIKQAKRELVKSILKTAGYDPTIRYTRKEIKKFTRIVKSKLFVKSSPRVLTDEEIKGNISKRKAKRAIEFESRLYVSPFGLKGVQPQYTAAELNVKEKPDDRSFKYVIQRRRSDKPDEYYDFLTDYIKADTLENAKLKAKDIAKKYEKDTSFTGINLTDSKDNSKMFYSRGILLENAA